MTEHALILRVRAAQATLDEWKERTFCLGQADCARMAGWHPDAPGGAVVMQPRDMVAAWRVEPKGGAK